MTDKIRDTDTTTEVAEKKETDIKYRIRPTRYINYDCGSKDWEIEVHLPGVEKSNISLKILK